MDVTVEKKEVEGKLVITMTFEQPKFEHFSKEEWILTEQIEEGLKKIDEVFPPDYRGNENNGSILKSMLFNMKEKIYARLRAKMRGAIQTFVMGNVEAICQMAYEWNLDKQPEHIKKLMREFDPEHYKLYLRDSNGFQTEEDD